MQDHYETLQVHPKADQEMLRSAYESLCLRYDPKQFGGMAKDLINSVRQKRTNIDEAYVILSNPDLREAYDAQYFQKASIRTNAVTTSANLLDYTPLPPAKGAERPRGFNAQPHWNPASQMERPSPKLNPYLTSPVLIVAAIAFVVTLVSLVLTNGGRPQNVANSNLAPTQTAQDKTLEQFEGQIVAAKQVVDGLPEDENAWIQLGNALYDSMQVLQENMAGSAIYKERLPRWLEASEAYSKALQLNPQNHLVRADKGVSLCYYGTGINDQSYVTRGLEEVQRAGQAMPQDGRVLLNLGICLVNSQPPKTSEALEQWHKVLTLTPAEEGIKLTAQQLIAKYGQ